MQGWDSIRAQHLSLETLLMGDGGVSQMSTLIEASRATVPSEPQLLSWTEMVTGVWLAKQGTDFAGVIERMWGAGYRVTDRLGRIVGEFSTFDSASRQLQ